MDDSIRSASDAAAGLPANFRPLCTTVDEIVARRMADRDNKEEEEEEEEKEKRRPELEDFRVLMRCFPDATLDTLYINFVKVINLKKKSQNLVAKNRKI